MLVSWFMYFSTNNVISPNVANAVFLAVTADQVADLE